MEGRPLLKKTKKINIHIDSECFEKLLNNSNDVAYTILSYHRSEYFNFVKSPFSTSHDELQNIPDYNLIIDESSEKCGIEIKTNQFNKSYYFEYKATDIRRIAESVYQKEKVTDLEYYEVEKVFVQAIFNRQDSSFYSSQFSSRYERYEGFEEINIYITNNDIILKKRLWFENHFPGYPLNIMTVEEASLLMNLFLINNDLYCASSQCYYSKWYWYWFSMRLKLPHFNVGRTFIDALANRFCYSIMALDEIGKQYFLGVNNNTIETKIYHFNYLITLITGIFDNLALHTNGCLGINEENLFNVSLSSSRKKGKFLKKVEGENAPLRKHINKHSNLINLFFLLRDPIIHREGVSTTRFHYKDEEVEWEASFIFITKKINMAIQDCGDLPRSYDPFSEWGVYQQHTHFYLEPYHFSIQAITKMAEFVDEYLKLLGDPSFMENSTLRKELETFKYYKLGF